MSQKYNIDLYLKFRQSIKCGDALEWRSETTLGKSIRFITGYEVNHTSQVITFDQFYNGIPLRIYTLEALSHGIELNLLSRRLENFKGKIYWLPLKDEFKNYRKEILIENFKNLNKSQLEKKAKLSYNTNNVYEEMSRLGLERIGIPYDFSSIKKIFFKVLFFGSHSIQSSLDKLYCSEYVFYNGKDTGLPIIDKFKKAVPVPGEMIFTGWYKDKILIHNT